MYTMHGKIHIQCMAEYNIWHSLLKQPCGDIYMYHIYMYQNVWSGILHKELHVACQRAQRVALLIEQGKCSLLKIHVYAQRPHEDGQNACPCTSVVMI